MKVAAYLISFLVAIICLVVMLIRIHQGDLNGAITPLVIGIISCIIAMIQGRTLFKK